MGETETVFPIVLGCVRSGTTMLRAMLHSHPDVAVAPESYFVVPALQRRWRYEADGRLDHRALLGDLGRDPSFTDWRVTADACHVAWREGDARSVSEALAALYLLYAHRRAKPRAADKTPFHLLHVDLLARAFPNARFVHLVRDGRDVVPSILGMSFGPDRFARAVLFWEQRVAAGRDAGRRLAAGRYREVHYEQLVSDPEPVLRDVCTTFDLPYSPAMLDYHQQADDVLDGLRFTGHHQGIRQPPTREVRNWRATMPARQVQLFEALAGDLLDDLGYPRSSLALGSRTRAEAAAWRAATGVEELTRPLRRRVSRRLAVNAGTRGRG